MQVLNRISSGWTTLKIIRVVLGMWILISSLIEGHIGGILLGTLFTLIALFTDGVCCAGGACYHLPVRKDESNNFNDTDYEELGTRQ